MKFFEKLEWIFDYYFAWITYNGRKMHKYNEYMIERWGDKYKSKFK